MMKIRRLYMTMLSVFAICLFLAGCGKGKKTEKEQNETKVWSTYSSVKVLQNQKDDLAYDELEAMCDIQMMRNETEGTQLIITATEDIDAYDLVVSDLKDDNGNVISVEDIKVYHQKYMVVNSKTDILNEDIIVGDYVPDMLLPLDTAKEYGENTITAGHNQGITIEITTFSETVAGTYSGTFTLKMDDKSLDIPVNVEVWDIAWEGKREFQSSFLIYSNALLAGEYEVSEELIERYQDFFLDYKINTFVIRSEDSVETLAKEAVTFFDNDNYSSICIPNTMSGGLSDSNKDKIVEYIREIVRMSSTEKPYFEYLYIYPAYFDEVDMYPEKQGEFVEVFKQGGEWEQLLKRALQEVKGLSEYQAFDAELKKQVEASIISIPAVVPCTTTNAKWVDELGVTFCPYLSLFNEQKVSQRYQRQAKELNNGNLWAYTCVGPTNPYPTFHIDDYNLGTRVTGWMLKEHGVNGYLYWAVNIFEPVNADSWRDVDPYATAERASDCAGDGYLCYPGAYYGSKYPFPCIRLTAYRDTMDDYDMLTIYEKLLQEKEAVYGIEIDFASCVEDLYCSLYSGTQYYNDDALVVAAREQLAQRILALQSELEIVTVSGQNSITLYATSATLDINGSKVDGTVCTGGYKYTIENQEKTCKPVVVSSEDLSVTYRVNATKTLTMGNVSKSSDSKAFVDAGVLEAVICSEQKENAGAMTRFKPYVQFEIEDIAGTSSIHFTFNLHTSEEVEGSVYFVMSDMTTKEVGSFLADSSSQDVEIVYNADKITDEILEDVIAIRIAFDNTDADGALLPNREISLENLYAEMR